MEYPIFTKRDTLTKTARTFLPTQFNPFECKLLNNCFENGAGLVSTPSISETYKDITKRRFNVAATLLSKCDKDKYPITLFNFERKYVISHYRQFQMLFMHPISL